MLYVLRLSSGDCIVTSAADEVSARALNGTLKLEDGETIASARALSSFSVRFSPTDDASLEVNSWDDPGLNDILVNEYPLLNKAFHLANSVRFMPPPNSTKPLVEQLRDAHEQNSEILRKALRLELERLNSEQVLKQSTAHH